MKKILIVGENSYVGNALKNWLSNFPNEYFVDLVSSRDDNWKKKDFALYDTLYHVAGIAHIKETKENANLYYKVNRDLAFETAKKAKQEGVKQFIFLSSMSVYGIETGTIKQDTPLKPISNYGKSKLQAEKLITSLEDKSFKVVILRPPMIYGKGCKGNYVRLANFAKKAPIFPNVDNRRSMIFIDNLSMYVKWIIDNKQSGLFLPQNNDYINTSEMVRLIAEANSKEIKLTKLFNPLLYAMKYNQIVSKVLGNLVYDINLSRVNEINMIPFENSIFKTEQ